MKELLINKFSLFNDLCGQKVGTLRDYERVEALSQRKNIHK